jgi:glycosyltransferase involved in cell wall biosynthesis
MKSPFFSIVLPTYNRLYSLKAISLPSLEKQAFSDFELLIIDDCSDDGTDDYFRGQTYKADFPALALGTTYIRNTSNRGAPASRNIGAAMARAPWLYIIEDDIEINDPHFLGKARTLVEKADDSTAVISPKRAESIMKGYYKNPARSFARVGVLSGEIYVDPTQEYTGHVPNTHASSFVRTQVYNAFQEDEWTFHGNTFRDESDLYLRMTRRGHNLLYCGDALKSTHRNDYAQTGGQKKVHSSTLLAQEWMIWNNHYRYLRKNYGRQALLMILFFLFVRIVKTISNLTGISFLKNVLSLLKV